MNRSTFLTLVGFAILFVFTTYSAADTSEEIKKQLKFGVRAAKQDQWDEAVYRWRKALQLNPNNVMAHNNLAVAYEQLGEYELALEEYEIAYRFDSQNKMIKSNLDRFKDFYQKHTMQKD